MTQQRLIARQYMEGNLDPSADEPPNCTPPADPDQFCLVGDPNPSFHRIDSCSPGCDESPTLDPADCDSDNMEPANIWCSPAHIGQTSVTPFGTTATWYTPSNIVCKFFDNKYYGWMGSDIWEFDATSENQTYAGSPPTGNPSGNPGGLGSWTVAASPLAGASVSTAIGMYPMNIEGTPYLVTAGQRTASFDTGFWRIVKLNGNTGVWTSGEVTVTEGATSAATPGGTIHTEVRHKNNIHWITAGNSFNGRKLYTLNPQTENITTRSLPGIRFPMDLCVFENELYILAPCDNNVTNQCDLCVFKVGTTIQQILTLETGIHSISDNYEGRNAMFVDNYYEEKPKLYAINYMESKTGGVDGFGLWQMESSGNTLVSNGRLPSNPNMPRGVDNQGGNRNEIWRVFTDSKWMIGSGGIPIAVWRSSTNRGAAYTGYSWSGSGVGFPTTWGQVSVHFIFSYVHARGADIGSRVANFGEVNMDITGFSNNKVNQGLLGINYKLHPSYTDFPAGTPLAIRFLHETQGHSYKNIATLKNPSSGTLTIDNRILINAVSGVTFSVDWDFEADGFSSFDKVNLVGHVSTTGVA